MSVRPDTVSAVVRGAWRAVQAQLSALTHAFVRVAEPLDAPASLELEVDLPEGGFVSVTLQPARATVRPRGS